RQKLQRAWKGGVVIRMFLFFSSRRRHTRFSRDWSSDVCSSDLGRVAGLGGHEALARVSLAHAQELLQRPADAPAHGLPEVFQELVALAAERALVVPDLERLRARVLEQLRHGLRQDQQDAVDLQGL